MATTPRPGLSIAPTSVAGRLMPVNSAPANFDAARELPAGFLEFLTPLHEKLTLRQQALIGRRDAASPMHLRENSRVTCRLPSPRCSPGKSKCRDGASIN